MITAGILLALFGWLLYRLGKVIYWSIE